MWSEAKCAGVALAAVLWDDRALHGVDGSLPSEARERARAQLLPLEVEARPRVREPREEDRAHKHRQMRALVAQVRGELAGVAGLPARARALLARHVPRELGRRLIAETLEARPDFTPPTELVQTLLHQARTLPSRERTPDVATNPRG